MLVYMRQAVIHGYIPESRERAFHNAGKSGAVAFLNAGKEWTLFRTCSQGLVR